MHCDIGRGDGEVACAGSGGSADVDPGVLRLDVADEQVAAAQHLGVVDVDGLVVGSAPGDEGSGVPRRHALQQGALVQRHRLVLGARDDAGPLGDTGAWGWEREGENRTQNRYNLR